MNRSLLIVWSFLLLTTVHVSSVDGYNQTPEDCSCVGCICVYHYQCQKDGYVNDAGIGIFMPRSDGNACPSGSFTGEIKCCKRKPVSGKSSESSSEESDEDLTARKSGKDRKLESFMCGKSEKSDVSKSTFWDGKEYEICGKNEFPWITAIFRNENGNYTFFSSGSLIAPRVVLTVNHYLLSEYVEYSDLKIVYNGGNELPTANKQPADERNVNEIISHPDYDSSWINDIALIILDKPYDIPKPADMKSICLPPEDASLEKGERCVVAGWGREVIKNGNKVMRKVELPYVDDSTCEKTLKTTWNNTFKFQNTFLCAGGEKDKDVCHGDGGSPLMCPIRGTTDRYYIAGMVSWGVECGMQDVPGVYTNIQTLKGWILNELRIRKLWTA